MPYKEFEIDGIGKIKIYKRRGNRSLRLSVAADGDVRVTMPTWAPYQAGLAFTKSRKAWILAQSMRQDTTLLTHGQQIGKTHRLLISHDPSISGVRTKVRSGIISVTYGTKHTAGSHEVQDAAQAACWRALKTQAFTLLTPRLNELAAQHGFSYRSLNVKRMKTRWGSCDQHGNIVFNLFLMQLPWECIDYVILHELTHTRALHHGPDFWEQLETVLPSARRLKRQMRLYRPAIMVAPADKSMA